MPTISMLEFRQTADQVLGRVQKGERFLLTYRGKPVAQLEPVATANAREDDPIYRLYELANHSKGAAASQQALTNQQIDDIVYGP